MQRILLESSSPGSQTEVSPSEVTVPERPLSWRGHCPKEVTGGQKRMERKPSSTTCSESGPYLSRPSLYSMFATQPPTLVGMWNFLMVFQALSHSRYFCQPPCSDLFHLFPVGHATHSIPKKLFISLLPKRPRIKEGWER